MRITTCCAALIDDPCTLGKYDNIYMFSDKQCQPFQKLLMLAFLEFHVYIFKYILLLLFFSFMGFFSPFIFKKVQLPTSAYSPKM